MQKRLTQFVFIAEVAFIFTLHAVKINQGNKVSSSTSKLSSIQQKKVLSANKSHMLFIK